MSPTRKILIILGLFLLTVPVAADIHRIQLREPLGPAQASFIVSAMREAERAKASLILLELDTPGGLVDSMKEIIGQILNGEVPVVVFVEPSGAHAASAGFFILVSADVAAMAPGTNTGAAHPLLSFGGVMPLPEDETTKKMLEKAKNDIQAYLRGILKHRGRNEEAALAAITANASYTAEEALDKQLIDLVARDRAELLQKLDGRKVRLFNGREMVLKTAGEAVVTAEMSARESVLSFVSNPNVAVILALAGVLGLFFEFYHPGFIAPGVLGGICLILALLGFSMLPVNYVGVILIILAIGFFIAEIKLQGFGVLGIGGIVSLVLGFLMLVDSPDPSFSIAPWVIWGVVLPVGAVLMLFAHLVYQAMRRPSVTGREGMAGQTGTAETDLAPAGRVYAHGEYWEAVSEDGRTIPAKTRVRVVRTEGLRLYVRPTDNQPKGGE